MAEVQEKERSGAETAAQTDTEAAVQTGAEAVSAFSEAAPVPKKRKKNKKKTVRRIVSLVIVAALLGGGIFAWKRLRGGEDAQEEVLTEIVQRGSITSMVEGSGAAVAKNSESVTLLSGGQVREVFVAEGDFVTEGTPLFEIDSTEVEDAVTRARERVREQERALGERQKELDKYLKKAVSGDVTAEYAGIITEVKAEHSEGDDVTEKEAFATLADNTVMLLKLYFSYAYENDLSVGQSATVSVPVTMAQLPGKVHEIHKVDYITVEGGRMFEVVVAVDNPGTLTEGMEATATISGTHETIYPYRSGELKYFRTTELKAPLTGKLTWFEAYQWQKLAAGQSVARIEADTEDREAELKDINDRIEDAQKSLREAQDALEKELDNLKSLSGVASIDGTVLTVNIQPGDEVKAGTVAVSIADTSTMIVNAQVDEMNVSYAKAGMPVNIKLWENELFGVIDSVSLTATAENGVARFPMVISVDNSEGLLMSGAYVDYSFTASQSEDCLIVPIQCVKSAQTVDGENCKVLFVQTDEPVDNPVELDTNTMQIPDGFQPVYVEVGISDNNNVEIKSGVEEETVVYAGVMQNDGGMGMGMYF